MASPDPSLPVLGAKMFSVACMLKSRVHMLPGVPGTHFLHQPLPPSHSRDPGLHDAGAAKPTLNVQAERPLTTAPDSRVVLAQLTLSPLSPMTKSLDLLLRKAFILGTFQPDKVGEMHCFAGTWPHYRAHNA